MTNEKRFYVSMNLKVVSIRNYGINCRCFLVFNVRAICFKTKHVLATRFDRQYAKYAVNFTNFHQNLQKIIAFRRNFVSFTTKYALPDEPREFPKLLGSNFMR